MSSTAVPQITLEDYEHNPARHLLHGVVKTWAKEKPHAIALINANRHQELEWATFDLQSTALARQLLRLGLSRGDYFATCLPLLTEHILLEYACFQIGVIVVPLDLRSGPAEIIRSLGLIGASAFAFPGATPMADSRELGKVVQERCPFVRHLIQFSPPEETIAGALSFGVMAQAADPTEADGRRLQADYERAATAVKEDDGALAIFTTGSTGSPKPALLSHRNITCQNLCLSAAFFGPEARTLINLPPSHVGCQTELLMSTLFGGGTAIFLEAFDPARSLQAIQEYRVNKVGQIPALFNFEWRLKDYSKYDLSSLDFVAYGGQQISPGFARKLAAMAPRVATGLGLTEAAGFCTYIVEEAEGSERIATSLGRSMPLYPCSVRQAMRADGRAGDEVSAGQVGHICFRGPQTFLGYVNDPEATARTISRDGYLYTGDLGYTDNQGLHLTGRAKWVIKTAGYQVFPGDIENHICALEEKVASCAVVGVEHPTISEAIVAFVESKPGAALTRAELEKHARTLPPYMRPRHYVLLEPGQMPLNRAVKADYVRLAEMARQQFAK